ncbi:MAG TPA: TraR/DksA C4-type zinc finger protein [Solirubrobacteraceae bacterium]|nr:TraR/DksA C4-type zinc finger protein [Solirubrobacteraceae bacterium]
MDEARARELLARERTRIEGEIKHHVGRSEDSELSDVDQHMADDATNLYEDELDEGIVDQLREQLAAIERAEQRLKDGTYGTSVQSGEPIPDARLEAVPWAERTVEEQARLGG